MTTCSVLPSGPYDAVGPPNSIFLSRLNTQPTRCPVNASPLPSRTATHDSGPTWFATPWLGGTCTRETYRFVPAHREVKILMWLPDGRNVAARQAVHGSAPCARMVLGKVQTADPVLCQNSAVPSIYSFASSWVSEVSPAARNTLDFARIPRASKLLICGLFQKGRVLAQDGRVVLFPRTSGHIPPSKSRFCATAPKTRGRHSRAASVSPNDGGRRAAAEERHSQELARDEP